MTKSDKEYKASLLNFIKGCENCNEHSKQAIKNNQADISISRKRIELEKEAIKLSNKRIWEARRSILKLNRKK